LAKTPTTQSTADANQKAWEFAGLRVSPEIGRSFIRQFFSYWLMCEPGQQEWNKGRLVARLPGWNVFYTGLELRPGDLALLAVIAARVTQLGATRLAFTPSDLLDNVPGLAALVGSATDVEESMRRLRTNSVTFRTPDNLHEYACSLILHQAEEASVVLPPYLRTRPIRNIAAAARCQPDAVVQLDAA
jgi:hypothetical protein